MISSEWVIHRSEHIQWLSFPPLETYAFLLHGCIIKNRTLTQKTKREQVERFLRKISSSKRRLVTLSQMHQDECVVVACGDDLKGGYDGDAVLTNRDDIFISVSVADCLPIFLLDEKKRVVGLVHAGWRGTLLGVARRSMEQAEQHLGCRPGDFTALLGPCIRSCCYRLCEDVGILFDQENIRPGKDGGFMLDLVGANVKQLAGCGVKEDRMFVLDKCTCCDAEWFHSYRREGELGGKMIGFMALKQR